MPLIPNANQLTHKDLEPRSARQFTRDHKRKHNEYLNRDEIQHGMFSHDMKLQLSNANFQTY